MFFNKADEMVEQEKLNADDGGGTGKRLPYNLREQKDKKPSYRTVMRVRLADELYRKIVDIVEGQKKYRDPYYTAKDLARDLHTNSRYLSAVINSRFGKNYSCLLNDYRIKEALRLLQDRRHAERSIEEIGAMAGFTNRQSFYAAFYRNLGETPNNYRKRNEGKG